MVSIASELGSGTRAVGRMVLLPRRSRFEGVVKWKSWSLWLEHVLRFQARPFRWGCDHVAAMRSGRLEFAVLREVRLKKECTYRVWRGKRCCFARQFYHCNSHSNSKCSLALEHTDSVTEEVYCRFFHEPCFPVWRCRLFIDLKFQWGLTRLPA